MKNKKLAKLFEIVDKAYGDGLIKRCLDANGGLYPQLDKGGDTLSLFVARELYEVCEFVDGGPDGKWAAMCDAGITAMDTAIEDLGRVRQALVDAH